jgi:hypothetical protein
MAVSSLSLIMVKPAFAQSIPKPSVPEFTIKLVDHSYDVAPTTTSTTDPYNNKSTTTTIPGYHIQNITIDLKIKNQPFPTSIDGNTSYLLIDARVKGHFTENWTYPYSSIDSYPTQSNSQYTVISFPSNYSPGDEIDFQIEAILAHRYTYYLDGMHFSDYFSDSSSGWSPTQTVTISKPSVSASPSSTPTVPEFAFIAIPLLLLSLLSVAAILTQKKPKNLSKYA